MKIQESELHGVTQRHQASSYAPLRLFLCFVLLLATLLMGFPPDPSDTLRFLLCLGAILGLFLLFPRRYFRSYSLGITLSEDEKVRYFLLYAGEEIPIYEMNIVCVTVPLGGFWEKSTVVVRKAKTTWKIHSFSSRRRTVHVADHQKSLVRELTIMEALRLFREQPDNDIGALVMQQVDDTIRRQKVRLIHSTSSNFLQRVK